MIALLPLAIAAALIAAEFYALSLIPDRTDNLGTNIGE